MYFLNIISETKRIKRSIMLFVCRVCDLITSQKLHNNKYQEREREDVTNQWLVLTISDTKTHSLIEISFHKNHDFINIR